MFIMTFGVLFYHTCKRNDMHVQIIKREPQRLSSSTTDSFRSKECSNEFFITSSPVKIAFRTLGTFMGILTISLINISQQE